MSVIVISGVTCSGKTSLERVLHKRGCARVISHTTRPQRPGEVNGVDYHFVTDDEFDAMLSVGGFVETIAFGQARYGKSVRAFVAALSSGEHVATVLEPQGARALRRHCEHMGTPFTGVWIDCPAHIQAARFVERSLKMPQAEAAQRLGEMLSIEQDWMEWLRECTFRAEIRLSSQAGTPEALARSVMEIVGEEADSHGL
jgi:guanylate kinase